MEIFYQILQKKTHFYTPQKIGLITKNNVNLQQFMDQYQNNLQGVVEKGVYSHLLTDQIWISSFMKNYLIYGNGKVLLKTRRGCFVILEKQFIMIIKF